MITTLLFDIGFNFWGIYKNKGKSAYLDKKPWLELTNRNNCSNFKLMEKSAGQIS